MPLRRDSTPRTKTPRIWLALILLGTMITVWSSVSCANVKEPTEPSLAPPSSPNNPETVTPTDFLELPSRGYFMGLLPTPRQGKSFADAYRDAAACADFVPVWGRPTPFYNLAQELSGEWGKVFVEQYTRGNGMFPLLHMSFIGAGVTLVVPPGMSGATLQSQEWRKAYRQAALDIVRALRPRYLSLGNEVNRWYEKYGTKDSDPNGFQNYLSLYNEIYDAVKQLSPQTNVFCTFAREIVSENREADLKVLSLFGPRKLDILVFTSYPYVVQGIKRPQNIPDNYYSKVLSYMPGKPFGLSECAWSALDPFGGEQAQADFITQIAGRLTRGQGINLHFLGWPWLSALDDNDFIALIRKDGKERLAFAAWQRQFGGRSDKLIDD